jgi:TetR/AcrR family transcriptional regulator, regulator of biofilm formation and stress response
LLKVAGVTTRQHRPGAEARRQALLQATVEVAARAGIAAVTHRAVTEQAGLPLATVSYFFESINELTEEALRTRIRTEVRDLTALADALAETQAEPDEVARAFTADATRQLPQILALFELFLHAARNPGFRDAVSEALTATRQAAAAAARAAGAPDADAAAPLLVALTHGLALHELAVPGSLPPESMEKAFRAMFLGLLLDHGHVELALALRGRLSPTE